MTDDLVRVTLLATEILEDIGVTYAIGSSVASSMYGEVRASQDVDIVAELHGEQVAPLVRRCASTFFIDEPSVREAIARRSSFNLIHLETALKVEPTGPGTSGSTALAAAATAASSRGRGAGRGPGPPWRRRRR